MSAHRTMIIGLGLGLALSGAALGADFDGTGPLTCTGVTGLNCDAAKAACSKVKPDSQIKPIVKIDPVNKTVKSPYRTDLLPIANSAVNEEQLQLQGTAEKFAWSAIVNRHTGKMTLTVADRMGAYVIFGHCKAGTSD